MKTAIFPAIALSALGLSLMPLPAFASPDGMTGSYVGVTIDPNHPDASLRTFAEMGSPNWVVDEALRQRRGAPTPTPPAHAPTPTQFQGRLDLPNTAVSLRGEVVVDEQVRAVMPTLTYDLPVRDGANVYAGAGYRFVPTPGETAGDRSGAVLTTGVEAAVGDRFVVYGDAQMGLNRDPLSGNPPVRVQMGIGHRF